jgi:serine/threonine-protein kinase
MPEGIQTPFQGGVNIDISPDGSRMVFVGQAGERASGALQIFLRSLDELVARPVPGTEDALQPRFSPDGESLAFIEARGIAALPLSGGPRSVLVSDTDRSEVGGFAWGPDGSIYFPGSDGGIWRSSGGANPERVTAPTGEGEVHLWPDVLPGTRAVLFTRQIGSLDRSEIAVASMETGEIRTLFPGLMVRYAESGHLLYTSGIEGTLIAVPFDSETLEVTGAAQTVLESVRVGRDHGGSYFAISRTGVLFYRTDRSLGEMETTPVWVSRVDGSEEPAVLNPSGRFRDPAISPDGRRIAFERTLPGGRFDIWIYDRDGVGAPLRLTSEGDNLQPFWSPDGAEVGFSSVRLGTMALFSQPWDRSAPARLLRAAIPGRPLFEGSWSHDGSMVVYRETKYPISSDFAYAAPHPDSTAHPLFESPFAETSPDLSPDGRWIAYASDESGQFQVYVRPFLRAGGSTPISLDGGQSPVWTPDGSEIVYRDLAGAWWAASVRAAPEFLVTSRERLRLSPDLLRDGGSPHFDISPDDGRVLAIRGGTIVSTVQHIVVLDFFEELTEVVPP